MRVYANITNGLAFPHDDVCHFMSTHGHNCKMGYLRLDSMPYSAVIELLNRRQIKIIDATPHDKLMTDALKYGVTTWALIFNRAIKEEIRVADWQTKEMWRAAHGTDTAKKIVQRIRRLVSVYGSCDPVTIGNHIQIECHRLFPYDDKPELILPIRPFGNNRRWLNDWQAKLDRRINDQ